MIFRIMGGGGVAIMNILPMTGEISDPEIIDGYIETEQIIDGEITAVEIIEGEIIQ